MICSAGVAPFIGIAWFTMIKQLLTDFFAAVTYPVYNLQRPGILSDDGLGWVWQCNVFGHYVLVSCMHFASN
jgi:3-keto steroid reductase